MKKLILSMAIIFLALPIFAQQGKGSIKGVIKDDSGNALPNANVALVGTKFGASTDDNGNFLISNITPGNYEIGVTIIGYEQKRDKITVKENETIEFEFNLTDFQYQMPQVNVLANREGIFETVPGALTYINRKEIERIAPISGNEVLRRSPGVHVVDEEGVGMRVNIGVRGLDPDRSRSVLVMEDGIPVALAPYGEPEMYYTPAMDRMEGVEILKGSGSILYGPQTIGGVVNYITADPPAESSGSLTLRGGQGGFFSGNVAYGNTFGKAGFHVNYLRKQADNIGPTMFQIDDLSSKFKLQINKKSNLGVKIGVYNEESNSTYVGITQLMYDQGGDYDFARMAPDDVLRVRRYSASASHNYFFTKNLKLTTTAFGFTTTRDWQRQDFAYNSFNDAGELVYPGNYSGVTQGEEFLNTPGGAIFLRNSTGNRNRTFEVAGIESRLTSNYKLGNMDNEFTGGVRYMYERAFEQRINGKTHNARSGDLRDDEIRTGNAVSAYVHNQFHFTQNFSVTAGTRIEMFDYERNIIRQNFVDTSIVNQSGLAQLIPGAGFNYTIKKDVSIFGGVHRGFAPPRVKDAISNEGEVYELDAELSWNYELGFRSNFFNGLTFELTGFFMDFSNQVIPVAESAGGLGAGVMNGGATQHKGIEGMIAVELGKMMDLKGFNAIIDASVTYVEATFSEDRFKGEVNIAGNSVPYAPKVFLSSGLMVEHKSGLALRSTLTHVTSQFGDELNTVEPSANGRVGLIPSYTIIDGTLIYHLAKINTTFNISVKNLLDERYIVTRRPQGIRVGLPRFVTAGFKFNF
jgi:Fe(3+) dicitrate transport protein